MSNFIATLKTINWARKLVQFFISSWVQHDINRIIKNYDEFTKNDLEILKAIKRAKKNNDSQAIKHLMRQRHALRVQNSEFQKTNNS